MYSSRIYFHLISIIYVLIKMRTAAFLVLAMMTYNNMQLGSVIRNHWLWAIHQWQKRSHKYAIDFKVNIKEGDYSLRYVSQSFTLKCIKFSTQASFLGLLAMTIQGSK